MDRKIVKPKPDIFVLDPYGRVVPRDGAIVQWSSYWSRRLRDGVITVHEIEEPKPARKSRKKQPTPTEGTEE